jgi:hypothetical protein
MQRSKARGVRDRIASSKRRVKSNPPRQCSPAQGPNVLSTGVQDIAGLEAIEHVREVIAYLERGLLRALNRVTVESENLQCEPRQAAMDCHKFVNSKTGLVSRRHKAIIDQIPQMR